MKALLVLLILIFTLTANAEESEVTRLMNRLDEAAGYTLSNPDTAIVLAKNAYREIFSVSDDTLQAHANYSLARIYFRNSNYLLPEQAIKYQQLSLQYAHDREIRAFEKNLQISIQKQRNLQIFFYLLTALLLSLILLSILFARNRMKKVRLAMVETANQKLLTKSTLKEKLLVEEKLHAKNRELAEKAMYLIKKNELISNIAKQLMDLSQDMPEHCGPQLEQIIKSLRKDTDHQFWKEFQLRFNDVHHDFHQALNTRFPDLSPAERKLATFIRLNLTSKEIAAITYKAPDSIKVARSRLRKKLGLTTEENLTSFLNNF